MTPADLPLMMFAAGFGARMGALTADRPKPLIEVGGCALIDHALDLARAAGIDRIAVNTHYRAGQIARHLRGRPVTILHETPRILDTGGGLAAALPHLGTGPVFTLNTDAVWSAPEPFSPLAAAWRPEMGALLALVPLARAHGHRGRGDFAMDPQGRLRRGGDLVYTGAQIIDPAPLAAFPDPVFSLSAVWDDLAATGRLHGIVHCGEWSDVGHPGGIAVAEAMLAGV